MYVIFITVYIPAVTSDTSIMQGVQLYIEIGDRDFPSESPDEVVDILLVDLSLKVAEPLQENHTGMYKLVTMNLTITVFCEENFRGSDCTQCVLGFIGTDCNRRDPCFGVNCSGNGGCISDDMGTFHCVCDPGFTGELCQTNIDDCVGVNCSRNGVCVDRANTFTCDCDPGFTGELCQTNIDNCVGVDCSGNGQCVDEVNNFTCECSSGFSGPLCGSEGKI